VAAAADPPKLTEPAWTRTDAALLAALLALVVALFGRVVTFPFVNWDDIHFLVENPLLQRPTLAGALQVFVPGGVERELLYIPLTYLSHLLEAVTCGLTPATVHTVNLLLHLANVALVYRFCLRLSGDRRVGTIAALLWACHPLQVEAVAWAMGRKDLLGTLLALAALHAYLRFLRRGAPAHLGWTVAAFLGAVLAKPSFIILPALCVLLDYYVRDGVADARHWRHKIALVLIALLAYALNTRMPVQPPAEWHPLWFRLLAIPWVGFEWVRRFILFGQPVPFYAWPPLAEWPTLLIGGASFACSLVLALVVAWRRGWSAVWFGLLFFALGFLPAVSIIVQPRDFVTADRYGYFPLLGVAYLVAVALGGAWQAGRRRWAVAGLAWLGACLVCSCLQLGVWQDSVRLWTRVMARPPRLPLMYNNLGMAYIDRGDLARGRQVLERGAGLDTADSTLLANLGRVCLDLDQPAEAVSHLRRAVERQPRDAHAWYVMGDAWRAAGDLPGALQAYTTAVELRPSLAPAWAALGSARLAAGDLPGAETAFRQALQHGGASGPLHFNLGVLCEQAQRPAEALEHYRQAVRLDPTLAEAQYNLGTLLLQAGQFAAAEAAFRAALAEQDTPETRINLGRVCQELGRPAEAVEHYRHALSSGTPHAAQVQLFLGQALRQLQRYAEARAALTAALALDPALQTAQDELDRLPAP
jgi:tetratricopeptide (TPR) repeat protein